MERPLWAPQGIDLTRPSVARMYDFYLGGSHNFEVDRAAARQVLEIWPDLPAIVRANRAFMRRAVRHAVAMGINQFLDIGSGIPTFGNVHEVARAADPESRVVYVDNDPVAVAHSQAILTDDRRTAVVRADMRNPQDILDAPEVFGLLDQDRPVAVLMVALLHFVEDRDEPGKIIAEFRDALAPGSCLIVTHATFEGRLDEADEDRDVYRRMGNPLIMRPRAEIEKFFEGFEMVDPGLVFLDRWRPDPSDDTPAHDDPGWFSGYAGLGLKP